MHKRYRWMAAVVGLFLLGTYSVTADEEKHQVIETGAGEDMIHAPVSPITNEIDLLRRPETGVLYKALPLELYLTQKERWARQGKTLDEKKTPLRFTADYMRYNGKNGDVFAQGNVIISQAMNVCTTELIQGNMKTQHYDIPGHVLWNREGIYLNGTSAVYDGAKAVATLQNVNGRDNDFYYFSAKEANGEGKENHFSMKNGYLTTKSALAKVPDYRMEVDTIDVYPHSHYEAKGIKLKVKNTTILTLPSYRGSLKHRHAFRVWSLLPRPAFNSTDGIGLYNRLEMPLFGAKDLSIYAENYWFRKSGYKPKVGVYYEPSWGNVSIAVASERNFTDADDIVWVEKKPLIRISGRPISLWDDRLMLYLGGELAKQKEVYGNQVTTGKHWDLYAELRGKPIHLGKYVRFHWNTGYRTDVYKNTDIDRDTDEFHKSIRRNNWYYTLAFYGGYGRFYGWMHYVNRYLTNESPYAYDRYNEKSPMEWGVKVDITPLDALSVSWVTDMADGKIKHQYVTYYRDLHSFFAYAKYDITMKRTEVTFMAKDFEW
jgi:hypothetical protein